MASLGRSSRPEPRHDTLGFRYVSGRPPLIVIEGPGGTKEWVRGRTPASKSKCARCRARVSTVVSWRTLDTVPSRICDDCAQAILP
jgi:hypothetical protein